MACNLKHLTYSLLLFISLIGSSIADDEDLLEWVQQDNRRFLNAVLRVSNLNRTIEFYTQSLGMTVLRKREIPEKDSFGAVLGYGPEESQFVLRLKQIHEGESLDIGTAYGHFGIATEDAYGLVDIIRAGGGVITREPGTLPGLSQIFAFVEDPDGYSIEILERPPTPFPINHINLHVVDLDRAIQFYQQALGLQLILIFDNPLEQYTMAIMGFDTNFTQITTVELQYNYNVTEYTSGNGYIQVAISTDDVFTSADEVELVIQELGGSIIRAPDENNKTFSFLDPEGFKTVLVENQVLVENRLKKQRGKLQGISIASE
ncbi:hypothetical protein CCACVL1_11381 [Corchorus capsularis]|uniref:VOC domain-containing protein n=1 Tax=Corchorus capsularis TaxID=210143 RepID=A0A1R3ILT0_COCAP|nr:hypothetical protein CCACVL1_11381 [Corchorus capsularis]